MADLQARDLRVVLAKTLVQSDGKIRLEPAARLPGRPLTGPRDSGLRAGTRAREPASR